MAHNSAYLKVYSARLAGVGHTVFVSGGGVPLPPNRLTRDKPRGIARPTKKYDWESLAARVRAYVTG